MAEDKNLLDKIKDKARATAEGLKEQYGIGEKMGTPWPQAESSPLELYPNGSPRGFLPPLSINPIKEQQILESSNNILKKYGEYTYKDWRGHLLNPLKNASESGITVKRLNTNDKFNENKDFYTKVNDELDIPYSTRESYLLFDDNRTDYFRHGLQIIDNLNNLLPEGENLTNSTFRLDNFKSTPFEQNDPVIFGFDIIIDVENSPLLNGAIDDFLSNYSNIGEVASRIPIYENFKQQFIKFFKTKSTVSINETLTTFSKLRDSSYPENPVNPFQNRDMGKRAYLSYYLNKVEGIDKLVEQNTAEKKKFLTSYNTDLIKLSFNEDVSLSIGSLSHLYKMLYWSKPNGKSIIPENLLRFNCDIVVSELRNYNRVIRAIDTGQLQVIKDNASRYIYSLYDCQFYFSSMPHDTNVDIGGSNPSSYDRYSIEFDYKYSTLNFERFVPSTNGFGKYVGINNASMWKVNSENRTDSQSSETPSMISEFENKLGQRGVGEPLVVSIPQNKTYNKIVDTNNIDIQNINTKNFWDNLKERSKDIALQAKSNLEDRLIQSVTREAQFQVNKATALLNKTLNKVISANLQRSIRPPRNIYTEGKFNPQDLNSLSGAGARIFYDVRGELFNFLGDMGGVIGNRNRRF